VIGPIDLWINNAGLAPTPRIGDYTEEEIDLMLGVSLKGPILGSQAACVQCRLSVAGLRTAATRAARVAHLGLEAVMAFSDHQNVQTLKFYVDEEDGQQRQVSQLVAAQLHQPISSTTR